MSSRSRSAMNQGTLFMEDIMETNDMMSPDSTPTCTRQIYLFESEFNCKKLNDNNWNFQIAKSVSKPGGVPKFNVIWQSTKVAPGTFIAWDDVYALNWTATIPAPGLSVTVSGEWQECKLGESYDLDTNGYWQPSSTTNPDKKFMNIGNIQYRCTGTDGIHITIGVKNANRSFDIVYIDPVPLPPNSSAKYQPQEIVEWWYQTGGRTSTMINGADTAINELDFSVPPEETNKYYYSSTFSYIDGTWAVSPYPPVNALYAPLASSSMESNQARRLYSFWPALVKAVFTSVVSDAQQISVKASLGKLLSVICTGVSVTFIDSLNLEVTIGGLRLAMPNSLHTVGMSTDEIEKLVSDLLQVELDEGDLPTGETWDITVSPN